MNFEQLSARLTLTLIRGVSGAGKSTLAQILKSSASPYHTPHVYETDEYFMVGREYVFDKSKLPEYHQKNQQRTEEALRNGVSVIVPNTFIRNWEILPYLAIAQRQNARLRVIELHGSLANHRNLPEGYLRIMMERWESLNNDIRSYIKETNAQ